MINPYRLNLVKKVIAQIQINIVRIVIQEKCARPTKEIRTGSVKCHKRNPDYRGPMLIIRHHKCKNDHI